METKKIEALLAKIKEIRRTKGYTFENMPNELQISHSVYQKIENNQSKLTSRKTHADCCYF